MLISYKLSGFSHWSYNFEASALIVGKTGYAQNNAYKVIAFDMDTGQNKWKYDPKTKMPAGSHGITYDKDVIYAPTGPNGTIIALNAENGTKIWESPYHSPQSDHSFSPHLPWFGRIM